MARSPAVWVVTDSIGVPVAAFTVKHELCTWLYKYDNQKVIPGLRGWKVIDGYKPWLDKPRGGPWLLDLLALREEGRVNEENKNRPATRLWG